MLSLDVVYVSCVVGSLLVARSLLSAAGGGVGGGFLAWKLSASQFCSLNSPPPTNVARNRFQLQTELFQNITNRLKTM